MRPTLRMLPVVLFAFALLGTTVARATAGESIFDAPEKAVDRSPSLVDDLQLDLGLGGGDSVNVNIGGGGGGGHFLSAVLSVFVPGLGQVFNGQVLKGIVVFVIFVALTGGFGFSVYQPVYGPALGSLFGLLGFLWWIGNIVDAYTGNFYGFLPGDNGRGCAGDVGPLTKDERMDLVVPVARPAT